MRVTFVSPSAYPSLVDIGIEFAGGAEFQQIGVARWLRDRGHDVSFVVGDFGQPELQVVEGIRLFRSFRLGSGNRRLRFAPDMRLLRRAIHRSQPEIVNQRSTSFYTGQCCWFSHQVGAAFGFSLGIDYNCWPDLQGRAKWPIPFLYRWGVEHADLVMAQTREQAQLMQQNFACRPVVTPNVLEIPQARGPGEDQGYVLWVGSLAKRKRPEIFVDLAKSLPQFHFVLVGGPGEDAGYDSEMRSRSRGVTNLEWRGFVAPAEMDAVYRGARLLVGTSRLEGLPNTYLQAWANGVPVVSSSVDPDGVIADLGIGELVAPPAQLSKVVSEWMSDVGRCQHAGLLARDYVKSHHDVEVVAQRIESIFQEAIDRRD